MGKKIIIIGAGPTGLGASYRLAEFGYKNWATFEKNNYVGGLAASFRDQKGFSWDVGVHVLYSKYPYFNRLLDRLLADEYLEHQRNSFVWLMNRYIPYPFQNNIRYLPKPQMLECLLGLMNICGNNKKSVNFKEWIFNTFGLGIARYFMIPYNRKLWRYPLGKISRDWIPERVSTINLKDIIENIIYNRNDNQWGPNNTFRFPCYNGVGGLFQKFLPFIKENLYLNEELIEVDIRKKTVKSRDGREEPFDILLNTTPLDKFIRTIKPRQELLLKQCSFLKKNSVLVIGIGIKGLCPSNKNWIYFPESEIPFYRVTYHSNHSPYITPDSSSYYSLICEVAYCGKINNIAAMVKKTINSLLKCNLIPPAHKKRIVSVYTIKSDYAYPIPVLGRDKVLRIINRELKNKGIYSRGRFGAWRYEVGNMDHSFMQGVELINKLLLNEEPSIIK